MTSTYLGRRNPSKNLWQGTNQMRESILSHRMAIKKILFNLGVKRAVWDYDRSNEANLPVNEALIFFWGGGLILPVHAPKVQLCFRSHIHQLYYQVEHSTLLTQDHFIHPSSPVPVCVSVKEQRLKYQNGYRTPQPVWYKQSALCPLDLSCIQDYSSLRQSTIIFMLQ